MLCYRCGQCHSHSMNALAPQSERRTAIRRKLLVTGLSPSARLVGLQVEMAAHNLNGNKACATRAFKFNLKIDWEARRVNFNSTQFNATRMNSPERVHLSRDTSEV